MGGAVVVRRVGVVVSGLLLLLNSKIRHLFAMQIISIVSCTIKSGEKIYYSRLQQRIIAATSFSWPGSPNGPNTHTFHRIPEKHTIELRPVGAALPPSRTPFQSSFFVAPSSKSARSSDSSFSTEISVTFRMHATLASISSLSIATMEAFSAVVDALRNIRSRSSFVAERNRSALLARRPSSPMVEFRENWSNFVAPWLPGHHCL